MAKKKITELPGIATVSESDLIAVVDADQLITKKATLSQVFNIIQSNSPTYSIQFNNGSVISGSSNLIYNYTSGILSGTIAQFSIVTASVISASTIIGIPTDIARLNNENLFTANNIFQGPLTASYAKIGDLNVDKITAKEYVTYTVTTNSGSTKFGNSLDDTHEFIGNVNITGSVYIDNLFASHIETDDIVGTSGNFNTVFASDIIAASIRSDYGGFVLKEYGVSGSAGLFWDEQDYSLGIYTTQGTGSFAETDLRLKLSDTSLSGTTAQFTTVTASVISASTYVGIPAGDVTAAGNNTFTGINTFQNDVSITGSLVILTDNKEIRFDGSQGTVSGSGFIIEQDGTGSAGFFYNEDSLNIYTTQGTGSFAETDLRLKLSDTSLSGTTAQFTTVSASVVSASTYVGIDTSMPGGPEYSLQFNSGSELSGSEMLLWNFETNDLYLSGNMNVSGNLKIDYQELVFEVQNSSSVNVTGVGFTLEESGSGGTAIVHETDKLKFYVKSADGVFQTSDLRFEVGVNGISASNYIGIPPADVTQTGSNVFTGNNIFESSANQFTGSFSGSLAKFTIVSASVISASTYVGIPAGDVTAAGNNTFTGINTFTTVSASVISASTYVGIPAGDVTAAGNNTFTGINTFTTVSASVISASTYVGLPAIGGATTLDELTDVDTTSSPPANGQVLVYSTASNNWQPGTVEAGGSGDVTAAGNNTFTGINTFQNDVSITGSLVILAGNKEIRFDGSVGTVSGSGFIIEQDGTGSAGFFYNEDSLNIYTTQGTGSFAGTDLRLKLSNTSLSGTTAQFTTVSASVISASTYVGLPTIGGATTLDDLTDVNVPSPTDKQVLIYNSTSSLWEAGTVEAGGGTATVTGPEYSLQFNSGSQLSGSQNLRWDYNTNNLYITGSLFATTKSFDIVHPTKSNMRLRYGSLEGPENGVYIRGKTKQNMVELPDYWIELVDENTISVNLTPIGSKQDIWVEKIENNILYIGGLLQECYFTVFGERKDVDKLVVEY